jgi:hypothetical protein
LRLPTEVDDEQITANGILPQPIGKTPLISGFNINTNLFRILNDALLLQRRRTTPTVDSVLADLQNVTGLREKVMQTTLEVADPLQLRTAYDSRVFSPSVDWESKLQERFLNYFQAPSESAHALNSFLVMQVSMVVGSHTGVPMLILGKHTRHPTSRPPGSAPDEGRPARAACATHANAGSRGRRNGGTANCRGTGGHCLRITRRAE